ncbi:MAG: PEP-CTERM sorting domain-containing protein [Sedimentisphaerales bacterium]|nr:PEP-CTERM sorting domain-containing protein [Sedimentisphaerales bacterium]
MNSRSHKVVHLVQALAIMLLSAKAGFGVVVPWISMASQPDYLLEQANLHNPGGIDHSWNDMPLVDPGQRNLADFRDEMSVGGRYGGGLNWDDLQPGTEIADGAGVSLDIFGLPFDARINAGTNGKSMTVAYKEQPQSEPKNAGPVSGDKYIVEFDNINPSDLALYFQTEEGYDLHGFGIVFANSGWSLGGATITFYNMRKQLAQFDTDDGVLFLDHSTDDNFIGYWGSEPITQVRITADDMVAMGRFDDIGLIFTPEPGTILLLALGGLALLRGHRQT